MFINILFIILLFLYPLGQLERIPVASPEIGFYFHDVIIGILLFFWLGKKIIKKEKIKTFKFGKYILLFFGIAFFSYLINIPKRTGSEILIAGLYLVRWLTYSGLYFLVCEYSTLLRTEMKQTRKDGRSRLNQEGRHFVLSDLNFKKIFKLGINWWLVIIGFITAVFGLVQYFIYPDIRPLTVFEWDPHYFRVVGTFLEPGFVGLVYVLTMILGVIMFWSGKLNSSKKTILGIIIFISYVAFALTYSRSAYLSYLLAMFIIALVKKSWRFLVTVLIIFILTLSILPRPSGEGVKLERQSTFWTRFSSWQNSFKIWKDYPIFGVGFNFYRYANRDYGFSDKDRWLYSHAGAGADNSFLFVLATTGITGLSLYILMLYKILGRSFRNINKPEKLILFSSFASCGIHAIFNNTLFYPWIMIWLWMLLGFYGV